MKFSQIKAVKDFCLGLMSEPCWREVVENVTSGETDFEVDNVRFISADTIDEVLAGELAGDEYVLGCFNASFIAGVTGWPIALIEAAQKDEAYQALGEAIIKEGYTEEMAKQYASADGYGHHFNSYDGSEEELDINGTDFYVFDNR
jgi:hypothetical protein